MGMCFMFGNRAVQAGAAEKVEEAVRRAVKMGMNEFIVGNRGGFDGAAAEALMRVKAEMKEIKIYMLLAYHPVGRVLLREGFDGTVYPEGMEKVPARFAIVRANRWALERADHAIAYVRYGTGNSGKLLEYAMKIGVSVDIIK